MTDADHIQRMKLRLAIDRETKLIESYLENIRMYQQRINKRFHELGYLDHKLEEQR